MFDKIIVTKPLNDGTDGFRFEIKPLGIKGLTRKRQAGRKNSSRGFKISLGDCMTNVHLLRRSVYIEHKFNRSSERRLHNFAG